MADPIDPKKTTNGKLQSRAIKHAIYFTQERR